MTTYIDAASALLGDDPGCIRVIDYPELPNVTANICMGPMMAEYLGKLPAFAVVEDDAPAIVQIERDIAAAWTPGDMLTPIRDGGAPSLSAPPTFSLMAITTTETMTPTDIPVAPVSLPESALMLAAALVAVKLLNQGETA